MSLNISWLVLGLAAFMTVAMPQDANAESAASRELLAAAERGDGVALQRLIAASVPLDPVDAAGRTPLLIAVERNHGGAAALLIAAGANINAQAANADTPWLLAGALGRADMLRLMIPKGPDFRIRNRFGGNALIPACERGHVEAVRVLSDERDRRQSRQQSRLDLSARDRDPGRRRAAPCRGHAARAGGRRQSQHCGQGRRLTTRACKAQRSARGRPADRRRGWALAQVGKASRLTGHPQRRYNGVPRVEPIWNARLPPKREEAMATSFVVNGKPASTDAPAATPLLWVLREDLKLTGTKFGCGTGLCGACTIHIDGKRAFSCQTQVSQIAGKSITTIEGLSSELEPSTAEGLARRAACRNAATASPARSWPPPTCSGRNPSRRATRSWST